MRGKKKTLFILALLFLAGLTSGYIANTYAKYASEIPSKTGTATVAKWKFGTENAQPELTIKLSETAHEKTLVGDRIAPGTSGSFNIQLVNETTETGVDFTVTLSGVSNVPTNLKFYKEAEHTNEIALTTGSKITGQLAAKDPNGVSVPIYWAWEYGNSDVVTDTTNVDDTTAGTSDKDLTIVFSIIGVQTDPSLGEVRTGVGAWTIN